MLSHSSGRFLIKSKTWWLVCSAQPAQQVWNTMEKDSKYKLPEKVWKWKKFIVYILCLLRQSTNKFIVLILRYYTLAYVRSFWSYRQRSRKVNKIDNVLKLFSLMQVNFLIPSTSRGLFTLVADVLIQIATSSCEVRSAYPRLLPEGRSWKQL